jgi:hypothetical protein
MPACRGCGAAVTFVLTKNGKHMPTDPDGKSHFASCPQVKTSRRPALPKDTCHTCGSRNVLQAPGMGPHAAGLRCLDCRVFRWLRASDVTG